MKLNVAFRTEVNVLKEQAELDRAIIESLRSLDMSSSRRVEVSAPPSDGVFAEVGVQTLASGLSAHMDLSVPHARLQASQVDLQKPTRHPKSLQE